MNKILRFVRGLRSRRGNSLVLFALFLPVLLGIVALATDVGMQVTTKAKLQNGADAAAWAGVAYLPNSPTNAIWNGILYGYYNGISIFDSNVTITTTYYTNDTILVQPRQIVNFGFGNIVGMSSSNIGVRAKAIVGNLSESSGVVPWGLVNNNPDPYTFGRPWGTLTTVKLYNGSNGDFHALSIDGNGASDYRNGIANGTSTTVSIGTQWETKPGAMDGPTEQGLETRIALDEALNGNCDTFSQVATPLGNNLFHVNNWNSKRLIIVPIVDGPLHGGRYDVTVRAFTMFFIDSWAIHGNDLDVSGYFVNTTIPTKRFTSYYGSWGTRVIKFAQ
jgi:hypothetical protein